MEKSNERESLVITTTGKVDPTAVVRRVRGREAANEIADLTDAESNRLGTEGAAALLKELCKRLDLDATMKPYFETDGIKIYHDDCAKVLPLLEDYDMLLTDPPYGIGDMFDRANPRYRWSMEDRTARREWDKSPPPDWLLKMAIDKSKYAVIWGGNYFNLPPCRCFLIWAKPEKETWFSLADAEFAWTNVDHVARICSCERRETNAKHPTQKPLKLMRWCLHRKHPWGGDVNTVVDPFMGSGTTLVACQREGMSAIGIEQNEEYCEMAAGRLEQKQLF